MGSSEPVDLRRPRAFGLLAVARASYLIFAARATTGSGGDQPFFMVCGGFTESPRRAESPRGYPQRVGAKPRST